MIKPTVATMWMPIQRSARAASLIVLLAAAYGCGDSNSSTQPSTTTVTISAPIPVTPSTGTTVSADGLTLTVNNSTATSGTPSYSFQVASDSAFASIVAQTSGVSQGTSQTSWTVTVPLDDGAHFWRARASASGTDGPFSSAVSFTVQAGADTLPGDQVLLFDPLTTGGTLGDNRGGQFTPEGWLVIASSNSIVYDMPTIESGFLQFDMSGLDIRNLTRDARQLFFMWDPSLGSNMTENRFRVSLQKLDGRSSINDRWLRLRFITQGRQFDFGNPFRGWQTDRTYTIRIQWGMEEDNLVSRTFINGDQKFFFFYPRAYIPAIHRIELGAAGRAETPEGAIYSNVTIGRR